MISGKYIFAVGARKQFSQKILILEFNDKLMINFHLFDNIQKFHSKLKIKLSNINYYSRGSWIEMCKVHEN